MGYAYLRDPDAIYAESFRQVAAAADVSAFTPQDQDIARRMIHACGMPDIAQHIRLSKDVSHILREALTKSCTIFADCQMVHAGLMTKYLPQNIKVWQTLTDPRTPEIAAQLKTTRSAAAVELWRPHLAGSIVVIGNAPTALFHLLELLEAGADYPAVIIGCPVGFVGAAESKQALLDSGLGIPYVTLLGTQGGSAIAAAALNAAILSKG